MSSVTSANADATVATTTTTPVITIVSAPKLTTARTIGGTSFDGTADIAVALATTVTTNANLTGDVTSVGNATTIANNAVTNAKIAGSGTRDATTFYRGDGTFAAPTGGGDMVLATAQTNTGVKTFLDTTL